MREPREVDAEVYWSQEGDAWVGTFEEHHQPSRQVRVMGQNDFEVEVLLRAEDWHVEVSHYASGASRVKNWNRLADTNLALQLRIPDGRICGRGNPSLVVAAPTCSGNLARCPAPNTCKPKALIDHQGKSNCNANRV